jgi:acetate---CoA ligase (ADP-forming)
VTDTRPATDSLDALIAPRRIAVVGASPRAGHFANQPLVNLRRYGFRGEVYPVNPSHEEVDGRPCFPSLAALPQVPDLAVVVVRPDQTLTTIAECARVGVRAAIVLASGFAETGEADGLSMQQELLDTARAGGIRICGPNTLGVANFNDDTVPFASGNIPPQPIKGSIAVVSQSGGCGFTLVNRAWNLGVGVGHLAVAGNEIDVTIPELVGYYLGRPDVRTVLCYLEAIRDADGLRRVGELSARVGKPVFVMKTGTTERGQSAAAAHTGALATSDAVCDAAFAQWGFGRARTFDSLVAAGALAARHDRPAGGRLGIYAQGGGLAVVTADLFAAAGIELPSLSDATAEQLKELMPDTTPGNPFDSGGRFLSSGVDLLTEGLTAFVADPNLDAIAYCLMPVIGQRIEVYAEGIVRAAATSSKPSVVLQYRAGSLTEKATAMLSAADLLALDPPEAGIEGIRLWLGTGGAADPTTPAAGTTRRSPDVAIAARQLVATWSGTSMRTVGEHYAVDLLSRYGLPTTPQVLVRDPGDSRAAATKLRPPFAVKVASPDLPHRSDFGGVMLGVEADGVAAAVEQVMANARSANRDAVIEGATVAEMAPPGLELIVGIKVDPAFGPTVLVGLGGIWAETLEDTALRLPPIGEVDAMAMLRSLRGAALLFGSRGAPAVDIDALTDLIVRVGELAADLGDRVRAVEMNPVIAYPNGLRIVDALVDLA